MKMVLIGLAIYLAENWYFGWNYQPSCNAERLCDFISAGFIFAGAFEGAKKQIANEVVKRLKGLN